MMVVMWMMMDVWMMMRGFNWVDVWDGRGWLLHHAVKKCVGIATWAELG